MSKPRKMYHPKFGHVREVAERDVERWKAQGWRMSAPKGSKHTEAEPEPEGRHAVETPDEPAPAPQADEK